MRGSSSPPGPGDGRGVEGEGAQPRRVLAHGLLGALHQLLQTGKALVPNAVAALLHTPLRAVFAAVLASLGRTALTDDVSATLVIMGGGPAFSVPPQLVGGEDSLVLDDAGMTTPVLLSRRENDGHEKVSTPPGPVLGTIVAVKWRPSRGPTARPSLPQ